MDQRLSVVTLGVADLDRAAGFYEAFGWTAGERQESIVFFQLPGMILALFPLEALAADIGLDPADILRSGGRSSVTLAYNTRSRDEVAAVQAEAVNAGGRLVKPAAKVFWGGFSGYFADPDGHLWEVAHNPFWSLDESGRVSLAQ